jgi:hypothetical protein
MSFKDYLHEKAEESRHNETASYLMFIAGAIFFVGGILETLCLGKNPEWLVFIPYYVEPYPGAVLGLSLIMSGFCLIVFGLSVGIYYSRNRGWYMQELRKASALEESMMFRKTKYNKKTRRKNSKYKS